MTCLATESVNPLAVAGRYVRRHREGVRIDQLINDDRPAAVFQCGLQARDDVGRVLNAYALGPPSPRRPWRSSDS